MLAPTVELMLAMRAPPPALQFVIGVGADVPFHVWLSTAVSLVGLLRPSSIVGIGRRKSVNKGLPLREAIAAEGRRRDTEVIRWTTCNEVGFRHPTSGARAQSHYTQTGLIRKVSRQQTARAL